MSTGEQTFIEPVAGCSPSDGLPRDCQGRHGEFHGGSGKDAISAAVPGSSELHGARVRYVFHTFVLIEMMIGSMLEEVVDCPEAFSMKQFWSDCEHTEAKLRELKAQAILCLQNDFPPVVRGYKDIPG